MVKVLPLKQIFDSQQVLVGLNDEPVEIATTQDDTFFVATKQGKLFVD